MVDVNVIKDEAINFFSKLYFKEVKDKPINDNLFSHSLKECVVQLESQFSEEEVKEVVFSMDKDKSSGLTISPCFSTKCVGRLLNLTL